MQNNSVLIKRRRRNKKCHAIHLRLFSALLLLYSEGGGAGAALCTRSEHQLQASSVREQHWGDLNQVQSKRALDRNCSRPTDRPLNKNGECVVTIKNIACRRGAHLLLVKYIFPTIRSQQPIQQQQTRNASDPTKADLKLKLSVVPLTYGKSSATYFALHNKWSKLNLIVVPPFNVFMPENFPVPSAKPHPQFKLLWPGQTTALNSEYPSLFGLRVGRGRVGRRGVAVPYLSLQQGSYAIPYAREFTEENGVGVSGWAFNRSTNYKLLPHFIYSPQRVPCIGTHSIRQVWCSSNNLGWIEDRVLPHSPYSCGWHGTEYRSGPK